MAITPKTYSNILKYGTQAAYEALGVKDSNSLYFTDAGKLYKGSLDITEAARVVTSKPATPVAGVIYVIETPANGTTIETWDGSAWHMITNKIVTVVSSASTDSEVATAKAVYTVVNAVDTKVGDLDDLETTDQSSIVAAINEVNTTANDNAAEIGVTPSEGVAGSGIKKEIYDIKAGLGTAAASDVATVAIGTEGEATDALPTVAQIKTYVAQEVADLEGAMHFRAAVTPSEGQSDEAAMNAWYATAGKDPEKGDVFVVTTNNKEYIVSEVSAEKVPTYKELGDEGLYVQKSTRIAVAEDGTGGVDLEDNIKASELRTALNVADGAQVNVLEGVKVNGAALTVDSDKNVDILIAEGTANGTVKVNGTDVSVHGLGSAAWEDKDAFDAAGTADTLVGTLTGLTTDAKTNVVAAINEVDANADAAQLQADQNEADLAALATAVGWGTF